MRGIHPLNSVAKLVDVEMTAGEARDDEAEHPSLPLFVEDWHIWFSIDWS